MKASEFIQRLQSLMSVVGDVDVVIEQSVLLHGGGTLSGFYELCCCETQGVREDPPSGHPNLIYTDNYITDKDKVLQVIKIY